MISVIIPCYNYGRYIGQAIECIKEQTYTDWEILVIDDGSTDDTKQVVQSYCEKDQRITYFSQTNAGPSAARNRGIDYAKGEFVQFLDPDDLFEKEKFQKEISIFQQQPQADIVYGSLRYFTHDPYDPKDRKYSFWGVDEEWMPGYQGPGLDILPKALKGNFTHFCGMLFRRSIIQKAGRFDEINNAPSDYTYILQCVIQNAYFVYHNTPGTYGLIRVHGNNLSKNHSRMLQEEINARIILAPSFANNKQATAANEYAIKSHQLTLEGSWKKIFLSGGPFDIFKRIIKFLRIDGILRKIFYR